MAIRRHRPPNPVELRFIDRLAGRQPCGNSEDPGAISADRVATVPDDAGVRHAPPHQRILASRGAGLDGAVSRPSSAPLPAPALGVLPCARARCAARAITLDLPAASVFGMSAPARGVWTRTWSVDNSRRYGLRGGQVPAHQDKHIPGVTVGGRQTVTADFPAELAFPVSKPMPLQPPSIDGC